MPWDLPGRQADPGRWNLDPKQGWVPPGQAADRSRLQYTLPHGMRPDQIPDWHLLMSPAGVSAPRLAVNYTRGNGKSAGEVAPVGSQAPVDRPNFSMLPARAAVPTPSTASSPLQNGVGAGQAEGGGGADVPWWQDPSLTGDTTPSVPPTPSDSLTNPAGTQHDQPAPSPADPPAADPSGTRPGRSSTTTRTTTDPYGGTSTSTSSTTTVDPSKVSVRVVKANGKTMLLAIDEQGNVISQQDLGTDTPKNTTRAIKVGSGYKLITFDNEGNVVSSSDIGSASSTAPRNTTRTYNIQGEDGQTHTMQEVVDPQGNVVSTQDLGVKGTTGSSAPHVREYTVIQQDGSPHRMRDTLNSDGSVQSTEDLGVAPGGRPTATIGPGQELVNQVSGKTIASLPPAPDYRQIGNQIYDMNTGQPIGQAPTPLSIQSLDTPSGGREVFGVDPYTGQPTQIYNQPGEPRFSGGNMYIPGDWTGNVQNYDPKTDTSTWTHYQGTPWTPPASFKSGAPAAQPAASAPPSGAPSTPDSGPMRGLLPAGMAGTQEDPGIGPVASGSMPLTPAIQGWTPPGPFAQSGLSEGRGRALNPQDDPMLQNDVGEGQGEMQLPIYQPSADPREIEGQEGGNTDPNSLMHLRVLPGDFAPMRPWDITPGATGTGQAGPPPQGGSSMGPPPTPPPGMGGGLDKNKILDLLTEMVKGVNTDYPMMHKPEGPQGAPPPPQGMPQGMPQPGAVPMPQPGMPPPGMPPMGGMPPTGAGQDNHGGMPWTPPIDPKQVVGTGHKFGEQVSIEGTHKGVDLQAYRGTPARSPVDGVVVRVDHNPSGLGITVTIRDAQGHEHTLGHLGSVNVKPGDKVRAGQPVASVGSTGASTGPHLDVREKAPNGAPIDVSPKLGMLAQLPRADNGMEPGEEMPMPDIPQVTPGAGQDNVIDMQQGPGRVWSPPFGAGQDVGVGGSYTVALAGGGEMTVNASSPQAAQDNVRAQGGTPTNDISTHGAGTTSWAQSSGHGGTGQPNYSMDAGGGGGGGGGGGSIQPNWYDQAQIQLAQQRLQQAAQTENDRHQEAMAQAKTAEEQVQENIRHNQAMEAFQIADAQLQAGTQIGIANAQIAAQFGLQSQQFLQSVATSALQNPWLQRLTGLAPGYGQVGGPGGSPWVPPTGGENFGQIVAGAASSPFIPQAQMPNVFGSSGGAQASQPATGATGRSGLSGASVPFSPTPVSFQDFSQWSPFQLAAWRTGLEAQGPGAFANEQDFLANQWGQQGITGPSNQSQLSWDQSGPMGQMQTGMQSEFFGQNPDQFLGSQQKNWARAKQAQVGMVA